MIEGFIGILINISAVKTLESQHILVLKVFSFKKVQIV
jgi:hypothetical protein